MSTITVYFKDENYAKVFRGNTKKCKWAKKYFNSLGLTSEIVKEPIIDKLNRIGE